MLTHQQLLVRRLERSASDLFSPGCSFSAGGVCCCTIHVHANALAPTISDGSLSLPGDAVSRGHCGVYLHLDGRRRAPLALGVLVTSGGLWSYDP